MVWIFPAALLFVSCQNAESKKAEKSEIVVTDSLSCTDCAFNYEWMEESQWSIDSSVCRRFSPPTGFTRIENEKGSFGEWLRGIPLLHEGSEVHLYNGSLKFNQGAQAAVINIDVGKADLQQCADAVMRLRAEYLFATRQYGKISFNYTSGDKQDYARWVNGRRIQVTGNKTKEVWNGTKYDPSLHTTLIKYMQDVFSYCGTLSLSRELHSIPVDSIQPGDVFIHGGTPGHAEIVMDVAVDKDGKKMFMLAQSYMPAQQMHILRNPDAAGSDPWYTTDFGETLVTPEYDFSRSELMRW